MRRAATKCEENGRDSDRVRASPGASANEAGQGGTRFGFDREKDSAVRPAREFIDKASSEFARPLRLAYCQLYRQRWGFGGMGGGRHRQGISNITN
jgi:hypothetical protein